MKKSAILLTTAAAVLALSACSQTEPPETTAEPPVSTTQASEPATTPPTELPPATTEPDASVLTEAQLAPFKELFEPDFSWYSQALTDSYDSPQSVSFRELFYNGNLDDFGEDHGVPRPSEEEIQYLIDHYDRASEAAHLDCIKISRADMEAVLQTLFGLSIEETDQVQLDQFDYNPDTDCYYHFHGDTNSMTAEITDGRWLDDATAELHYAGSFHREGTVVMQQRGGSWYILSSSAQP